MANILLLDTNYLCHRAFHAVGAMSHNDIATGTIYGVLRDIVSLQESFKTAHCVFAFDSDGRGLRQDLLPGYKEGRRERYTNETDEEREARAAFRAQVRRLRDEYLPQAGFNNVFHAPGYEADDVIARVAQTADTMDGDIIMVASDQDLWQCLRPNVWLWNPHKKRGYSMEAFVAEWGLQPTQWARVKALAGCKSDDVPGVPGCGERTVAKWLRGELGANTKAYKALRAARGLYRANKIIVKLPFPGTPNFTIRPDSVTAESWYALAKSLGMKSLMETPPYGVTINKKGRRRGITEEGLGIAGP